MFSLADCLQSEDNEWSSRRVALYRRLPLLSVQNRMYVLRHMHSSSINHQLACLPPAATADHAKKHDQLMIDAAVDALALDTPVSPRIIHQLTLPLSKGGFGLLSAATAAAPALSAVVNSITHAAPLPSGVTALTAFRHADPLIHPTRNR